MRAMRNLTAFLTVIVAMVALSAGIRHLAGGAPPDPASTADPDEPEPVGPSETGPRPERNSVLPSRGPEVINARNQASGFTHPGVLVSADQLEFVRGRIRAGAQPWTDAYNVMRRSEFADTAWQPKARAVVECGYFSDPNVGCDDEWRDAVAAYTQALLWYLTGRDTYARKAVEILDAWSGTLQAHVNLNAPIQAAWSAAPFARAAEIMSHTYGAWPAAKIEQTAAMFRNVFQPLVAGGGSPGSWGNWDLIIIDAAAAIAVFLDDRPLFDQAIALWRGRVPAYIYLASDGGRPVEPAGVQLGGEAMVTFWFGQRTYVDGLTQETCRDLGHAAWGLEAMAQVAETARLQGIDLYGEIQPRLVSALEFHAGFAQGEPVPDWLCGGSLTAKFTPIPELALNHYRVRVGVDLPKTTRFVEAMRPQPASYFYAWETLTHANNPR
jgi:hypothetical protein